MEPHRHHLIVRYYAQISLRRVSIGNRGATRVDLIVTADWGFYPMASQTRTIYLLMEPKGAGKTYLATRMETEIAIPFLRVETIWLDLSAEMNPGTPEFDQEGQRRVLSQARTLLSSKSEIVLESTGTAPWFAGFHEQLKALAKVILIRVHAPLSMCLRRIHERDASQHIAVSDERITEVNEMAERLKLQWSVTIENVSTDMADQFIESVRSGSLG